ncbi:hypothetical protein FB451DRAFT_1362359 [Mycena latifolia]|nr:hypothetical protein FB451DRAFT_1362359 [Mycena latifolia]
MRASPSPKPSERPTRIVVVIKQRVIFFRGFDFALGRVSGFYWGSIQVVRVTFGFAAAFAFFRAVWARGTASGLLRGLSHEIYQRYSTNKHEEVVTTKESGQNGCILGRHKSFTKKLGVILNSWPRRRNTVKQAEIGQMGDGDELYVDGGITEHLDY